jgi:hypothetical protein
MVLANFMKRCGMKRFSTLLVTTLLVAGIVDCAQAQRSRPVGSQSPRNYGRPRVTPYLDLLRDGGGVGLGYQYYRRLLPEQTLRRETGRLNRSVYDVEQQLRQPVAPPERTQSIGTTGHPTTFMTYSSYFNFGARSSGRQRRIGNRPR